VLKRLDGAQRPNVRLGSLADIVQRQRHVRFTSDSGRSSVQVECPKSANSRHAGLGLSDPAAFLLWDLLEPFGADHRLQP
jgi:hypothetical protein